MSIPVVFSFSGIFIVIGIFVIVTMAQMIVLYRTPEWKRWPLSIQLLISLLSTMVAWTLLTVISD